MVQSMRGSKGALAIPRAGAAPGQARLIDLAEVGATAGNPGAAGLPVHFGIYLPGLDPATYQVIVRVIHSADQFDPSIRTADFPLQAVPGSPASLWQADVTLRATGGSHLGHPGPHLYRYQ